MKFAYICIIKCVAEFTLFSGVHIFLVFCVAFLLLCLRSVFSAYCYTCLWIVHFWFPLRFSLMFIYVYCDYNTQSECLFYKYKNSIRIHINLNPMGRNSYSSGVFVYVRSNILYLVVIKEDHLNRVHGVRFQLILM